jgi:actin-related protein 8
VIDFEKKTIQQPELWNKDVDDFCEIGQGGIVSDTPNPVRSLFRRQKRTNLDVRKQSQTNAMKNSTRHLFLSTTSVPLTGSVPAPSVLQPAAPTVESSRSGTPATTAGGTEDVASASGGGGGASGGIALPPLPGLSATPSVGGSPAPTDKPSSSSSALVQPPAPPLSAPALTPQSIDTRRESSKIPLDVAVVESILAAGAEERMRKVAANLLIVGGTGGIHNVGFAVESR